MSVALEITYCDCQSVLDIVARSHASKFRRDFDTVRANANMLFLVAYDAFDYRGRFEDYLAQFVHRRLRDEWRGEQRRMIHEQNAARERDQSYQPTGFVLEDFLGGLNKDAAAMVHLALTGGDLPRGNKGTSRTRTRGVPARRNKGRPESRLGSIRRYLVRLGWTTWRVTKAVNEIRSKL